MRTSQTFQVHTILLLYLTTFAAAWPLHWPRWLPEMDTIIVQRDNANGTATQTSASPSATSDSGSSSGGGGTTFSITKSASPSTAKVTGASNATTTKTHATSYDARLPAGGVSMMTPAVASGQQYFKIGDYVTFGWNYTSLEATPTAVNVMATCTANTQLYTIATNVTLANNTNAVIWDTGSYQATAVQNPLLTQTYTLIIYDAASSISATAQAGYLAVYNQYTFGMYTPQAYTPLGEFKCATCSGALSDVERRALGMVVGMSILTVLSFTWFVGGTGIIW